MNPSDGDASGALGTKMRDQISFQDVNGQRISGRFDISQGMITVTARDGRTKMGGDRRRDAQP
jgi:hypothetical protein